MDQKSIKYKLLLAIHYAIYFPVHKTFRIPFDQKATESRFLSEKKIEQTQNTNT